MKTVYFKRIAIQNFLSVGDESVVVDFAKGLHILTGNNKDKPERKNAVGKSTIADAVYFAVFGETLREIKKDLIINNITGGKTHVELDFEVKSPRGNNTFKVIRTLSPTKAFVYKDGVDKTRDSIANTTKYICDVLSASTSIFQNCVIMTVNNAIPFMAKNKIDKRKFIEDIFGMEVFSKMISHVRGEYNDIKRQYDVEISKKEEIERTLTSYQIEKEKSLQRKKDKISLYKERYRSNEAELAELKQQVSEISSGVADSLRNNIEQLEKKGIVCDNKLHELLETYSSKKTTIVHVKDSYTKIGTSADICPVCLRKIDEHDKEKIKAEKNILKGTIEQLASEVKAASSEIDKIKKTRQKISDAITQKKNELSIEMVHQQNLKNKQDRIMQLEKWQEELQADLGILEDTSTEFDTLIQETTDRHSTIKQTINSINKQISNLDIVKFIISEEGVKSYIVNKLLQLLNDRLDFYLKKLDVNFTCMFNEFFEEEILNENNKICSYFNFSGAERKSIDLACLFAFSDMRRMQGNVSYNINIYDELFDSSFDEKGIDLISEILQERVEGQDECTIVISHRKESLKAVTGDVIFLEKENGITRRVEYSEF